MLFCLAFPHPPPFSPPPTFSFLTIPTNKTKPHHRLSLFFSFFLFFSVQVAAMEGGSPTIVTNSEGGRTTPSVVAYTKNGDRLVGQVSFLSPLLAYAQKKSNTPFCYPKRLAATRPGRVMLHPAAAVLKKKKKSFSFYRDSRHTPVPSLSQRRKSRGAERQNPEHPMRPSIVRVSSRAYESHPGCVDPCSAACSIVRADSRRALLLSWRGRKKKIQKSQRSVEYI